MDTLFQAFLRFTYSTYAENPKSLQLFSKNLSMASSGRPDIGISAIPYAPIRQIRQNSPLPGLYPKSPSTVPFLSNFSSKIFASPPLIIRKSEQKRYTSVALFSKKLPLSTTDYRKNTRKRSHLFSTFFQKSLSLYQ